MSRSSAVTIIELKGIVLSTHPVTIIELKGRKKNSLNGTINMGLLLVMTKCFLTYLDMNPYNGNYSAHVILYQQTGAMERNAAFKL